MMLSCIFLVIPSSAYAGINYEYCGHGTYNTPMGLGVWYKTVFKQQYGGFYYGSQLMQWHVYHDYKQSKYGVLTDYGQRTKACPM